jgi:tetratricopeptide (TPR) repeat protein
VRALVLACACLSVSAPGATGSTQTTERFDGLKRQAEDARAARQIDAAIAFYQQALALQPSWTEGHWALGTIYYDADRHRECRDAFAQVVEREPSHGAAWAFRGLCEFKLQEYGPALEHLNRAKQLGVGDAPEFQAVVGYHRAILLARAEEFERAFDIDAAFIRGGNTGPEILEALGIAMLRLPRLPSELTPDQRNMVLLAGRAGAFSIGMEREAAARTFAELVSNYSDAPNVHFVYGNFLASDHPAEALEQFKLELTRSPSNAHARVQIAQELIKQGDFEAATPYAAEAAKLAPKNFLARKTLGQIKLQAGDARGAVVELEAAKALQPSSPSVRFQLARAYQRAGRAEDANRERAEFTRLEALQQKQRGANVSGEPSEPPPQ